MEQKHRREKKMCPIHYGRKTRKERERHEERARETETQKRRWDSDMERNTERASDERETCRER